MMKILVTDGENRSSLAATRSLGRAGHEVVVCGVRRRTLASVSRFCCRGYGLPDPQFEAGEYLERLSALIEREKVEMVLPTSETTMDVLQGHRDCFSPSIHLLMPERKQTDILCEKASLVDCARQVKVPVPLSRFVRDADEGCRCAEEIFDFPVVIKPVRSRFPEDGGYSSGGVVYAADRADLERRYREDHALQYPSLIQERIRGEGTGLFTIFDGDRHLVLFSHRRVWEKPPSGGVSVMCESVEPDEDMVEYARRLLASVGWRGVAMVEFKRDRRDGEPKLMEINGRLWGSLQLAIACGVDFPQLLVEYWVGNIRTPREIRYPAGYRMVWPLGMLDYLIMRLRYGDDELHLPSGFPSVFDAVRDWSRVMLKCQGVDVFDLRDPMPFACECKDYVEAVLR